MAEADDATAHVDRVAPGQRFLLEREVAEIMRCSKEAVKRWRFSGELRYVPGKPVRIDRADFEAFLQTRKDNAAAAVAKAKHDARPFSEKTTAEQNAEARAWALKMKAKPRRTRGPPSA